MLKCADESVTLLTLKRQREENEWCAVRSAHKVYVGPDVVVVD